MIRLKEKKEIITCMKRDKRDNTNSYLHKEEKKDDKK